MNRIYFLRFKALFTSIFYLTLLFNSFFTLSAQTTNCARSDTTKPIARCKDITVSLDSMGITYLKAAQIDNGTTDNCLLKSIEINKTTFDCSNWGRNVVMLVATDTAGNSSSCSATVTVIDKIAPVITCPDNKVVQLASGECSRVLNFAATATDNCTPIPAITQLAGMKSGEVFNIGSFNTGFEAVDAVGNISNCLFNIVVKEHVEDGPMICRNQLNVTIEADCSTKAEAYWFLFGDHYGCFDHYTVQLMTQSGRIIPDATITADLIGTTLKGLIKSPNGTGCSFTGINIYDFTPPTILPPPTATILCDQVDASGIPLSKISGEPIIVQECSLPTTFYYTDNTFEPNCGYTQNTPPAGFPSDLTFSFGLARIARKVLVRTFYVSDRYFNTASTRQVIYVINKSLSDVSVPLNIDLPCSTTRIAPSDTSINGVLVHGTGFPTYPNNRAINESYCSIYAGYSDITLQNTPTKIIKRTWRVSNACTNEAKTLVQTLTFHDEAPVLSLLQNAEFQIPASQLLTIKATDLISSLSDACTPNDKMIYGIRFVGNETGFPTTTSLNFNCNQKGIFTVEIWVKDEAGNIVKQNTIFSVDNQAAKCPTIAGVIIREDSFPVPAAVVLYNSTNDSINSATDTRYIFKDLLLNNRFRVMPKRPNTDWLSGVTMFDVALLSRHLLGIQPLSTPYRIIAADVDRSNDIDGVDLLMMQRLILRILPTITTNNSWRFVLKNYAFVDPTNPFSSDFPESLLIPNFSTTIDNGDFIAIKVGDVNLSAGSVVIRGGLQPFILSLEDMVLEKNKTYQIPIKLSPFQRAYINNNISALQFALNIDKNKAQIEDMTAGDLPNCTDNNIGIFKKEGNITVGWLRQPNQKFIENDSFTLCNLTIKTTENTHLSQILSLNPAFTEGVAFDENGSGASVKLSFGNNYKSLEKPVLLPNRPNPFNDETTISFLMPDAGFAKLTVCDLLGRILMSIDKDCSKGLNELVFNSKNTPSVASGILIVRLQTGDGMAEQKIVLSR